MLIQSIQAEYREIYGSRRMLRKLRKRGIPGYKPRVKQLIQENASYVFQEKLKAYGMAGSMSRKGNY